MDEFINSIKYKLKSLAKKYNLEILVLFGSRATDTAREDSNFDFAYYNHKDLDFESYTQLLFELSKIVENDNIDLVSLKENDDPLLRKEILLSGICLYEENEGLIDELMVNAYFNYLDYLPNYSSLDSIMDEKLKKLVEFSKSLEE